jgi:hypothetical protein
MAHRVVSLRRNDTSGVGVKRTSQEHCSTGVIDPFRKSVRRKAIAQAARSSLTSRPAFGGQFELENRALPSSV